jgi:hypothetical protein
VTVSLLLLHSAAPGYEYVLFHSAAPGDEYLLLHSAALGDEYSIKRYFSPFLSPRGAMKNKKTRF